MKNLRSVFALAMSLASISMAQSVVADGFVHDPLGTARLSTNASGHLAVSNIGSSGLDGVRVNLPNPETHTVHFENGIEFAGFERVELRATVRNGAVGTASVSMQGDPAVGMILSPDFSPIGATGVRFLVFSDGVVGGMFDGWGALVVSSNGASPVSLHGVCNRRLSNDMMRLHFDDHDTVGPAVNISVDGGPAIACDELRLLPLGMPSPIVELLSTEIVVSGTPSLSWSDESASDQGTGYSGLGIAVLSDPPPGPSCPPYGCLTLSNIGSSGKDGVRFVVGNDPPLIQPGADTFTIALDELAPAVCNDGSPAVFYAANGMNSNGDRESIVITLFDNVGDAVEVTPEFSVGGSSVNVKLYYHGVEVLNTSVPTGAPALRILRDVPGGPGSLGSPISIDRMRVETGFPPDPIKGTPGVPPSSSFSLVGEAMVSVGTLPLTLCDAVVTSPNATGTFQTEILSMSLSGTDMPDIHVDLAATGQGPETHFGITLKREGVLMPDFFPTLDVTGQTTKVEVRGWNPEAKKEIVGEAAAGSGGMGIQITSTTRPHVDGVVVMSVAKISSDPIEFDHVMPATGSLVRVSGQDSTNPHRAGQRVTEARLNGRVVSRVVAFAPYTDELFEAPLLGAEGLDFQFAAWNRSGIVKVNCRSYCYQYQSPEPTTIAGGVPVLADEVQVTYCDLALPPNPIKGFRAEVEHGFGADLAVENHKLVAHELTHTIQGRGVWGPSALDPSEPGYGEDLVVRNIGSSGQDGVLIDLLNRPDSHTGAFIIPEVDDEVLVVFADGDPDRPVVIGSVWDAKFDFTAPPDDGTPPPDPIVVRGLRHELGHALDVDFGGGLVSLKTVSVWDAAGLVIVIQQDPSVPFDIARLPSPSPDSANTNPDGVVELAIVTDNTDPEKVYRVKLKFPWLGRFQFPDGTVVVGNRVEISARKSGNESSAIATLRLGGHGIPGFTITDVRTNRGPCQADLNGDGFLDNGDITTFIAMFLASDLGADLNGDGFLDNGDITTLIALFLAGC